MNFIFNKFDEFKRDRLEKAIKELKGEMTYLRGKIDNITVETDGQKQYSRRNCLLIHGIPENRNEDANTLVLEVIYTKMEIKITQNDIDRTHRIGTSKTSGKPRPLIIKFVQYSDRKKVFSSKTLLQDSGVSIMENLTAFRMKKLTNARETFGFRNVSTVDGRIFYCENGIQHLKIYSNEIILNVVVLQKMETSCTVLFALFSYFSFWGIFEGISHTYVYLILLYIVVLHL